MFLFTEMQNNKLSFRKRKTLYMADVHNNATRSYNMSRIRSKNTKPEILVRKFLHMRGFRYRLYNKALPGKPDIVLAKYKTVIFVNGCFWHGHEGCRYFTVPKTRTEYWTQKIENNRVNDLKAIDECLNAGWQVLIVWECDLKPDKIQETLAKLSGKIVA